jgi:hypothetical protein
MILSEVAKNPPTWAEANRLLGALASSIRSDKASRLGGGDSGDFEERAAIMEYNGGLSREVAELFARELATMGLEPSPEALAALDARLMALDARRVATPPARARRP